MGKSIPKACFSSFSCPSEGLDVSGVMEFPFPFSTSLEADPGGAISLFWAGEEALFFPEDCLSSQAVTTRIKRSRNRLKVRNMDFKVFLDTVPKIKKIALPGEQAHHKLVHDQRIEELAQINIDERKPRQAGVLAVFYPGKDGKTYLVLTLRKSYKGVHSNQVGFPGGRVEQTDRDLSHTALRETEEEVGIPQQEVRLIRQLTKLYIPPSNFWVQPFMGFLNQTPVLVPQELEVERILEVSLEHFLDRRNLVRRNLSTSYANDIEVPAFLLNDQIVWGATAMVLSEIKEMLEKVL